MHSQMVVTIAPTPATRGNHKKRAAPKCSPFRKYVAALPLRELEAAAGLGLAVFLPLDDAAVAGQEAG